MLYTIVYSYLHAIQQNIGYIGWYIAWYACYIAPYPPAGLAVYLAGSPTETRPDTPASSVSSSSRAPSQPPEGRDLDWEDYNYQQDPAAGGGQQGDLENPLPALLAGIPDFNTEELPPSWRLCCATCQFLTIQYKSTCRHDYG